MPDLTSPEIIDQFNSAAKLARDGKYEESLDEWNKLLEPSKKKKKKPGLMMSGEFLGTAMMRRAWVLMDLGRYEDARREFEDDVMQACLGQFTLETLFEYFFSYGNTLGQLGDIKKMDDALSRALGIAAEELGDLSRCAMVWNNLLVYAERKEDWKYLEKESKNAVTFAENTNSELLKLKGELYHTIALKGLGKAEQATKQAHDLMDFAERLEDQDTVSRLKELFDL
jgi:tetratricopeptide (TPR) repeat protein